MLENTSFIKKVPTKPGIYYMLDANKKIIYVGKAKNLKNRIKSYIDKIQQNIKTSNLLKNTKKIEYIIVNSEEDALIAENNYIKKYRPKYNILLKDDKTYPYILISNHQHPRVVYYRTKTKDTKEGKLFGPYTNIKQVKTYLALIQKIFKVRQCEDVFYKNRSKPCLQYQINRCLAPCVKGMVTDEKYTSQVKLVALFLKKKNHEIINDLKNKMQEASSNLDYEYAAKLRDQINEISTALHQTEVTTNKAEIDVIGVTHNDKIAIFHILFIRNGIIAASNNYKIRLPEKVTQKELVSSFVLQFYLQENILNGMPHEIITDEPIAESKILEETIYKAKNSKVVLKHNTNGFRNKFLAIAKQNAEHHFNIKIKANQDYQNKIKLLEQELASEKITNIHCFDVSHSQGEATIGALVSFNNQGADTKAFRQFNITGITKGDDYAAMYQTVVKTYSNPKQTIPELILIDGGVGQMHKAEIAIKETIAEENHPIIIAIAKGRSRKEGEETITISKTYKEVKLSKDSLVLRFIQEIRNASHNYAINAHRKKLAAAKNKSHLENIPNIGYEKSKIILQQFKGLDNLKKASLDEIMKVKGIGKKTAESIFDALHNKDN